jgi:DNA-binding beta-propeller fold protein YncE
VRALRAVLIAGVLLSPSLGATGCSDRPHANPFDPANPSTGGKPAAFVALAGNGLVDLRWQTASSPELLGYKLYRSLDPPSGYTAISDLLPAKTGEYFDRGLLNGTDHYYRLYYVFDRGLGSEFASDVATPGPITPWVADASSSAPALLRISADGRHIAERIKDAVTYSAGDLDVDPVTGAVWTCDPFLAGVTIYQPSTGSLTHAAGVVSDPVAVAVDPGDHSAWVGDTGSDQVAHFGADGGLASPPMLEPFSSPIGIAVDPVDHSVWICERTGSRVRHVRSDGTPLATAYVINPSRVAVDPASGEAWVTSVTRGRVVRLSPAGLRSDSVSSLAAPLGIVVDGTRGRIWITDPVAGRVVALDRALATKVAVSGLAGAADVALDPATGEAWVTAETAAVLVRIAPDGSILRRLGGFDTPVAVGIDPGTGAGPGPGTRPARAAARN